MATNDVLSGDKVKIYIEDVGVYADGTTGLSNEYQAEITSFNVNGGEIDYESQAVFGGFIDLKKPQSQLELTMDVIMRFGTNVTKWDEFKKSNVPKMIVIEATDGVSEYYWNAFNNVRVVNFDKEFEAAGEWRGSMTFKLSAKDSDGNENLQEGGLGAANDPTNGVQAWS